MAKGKDNFKVVYYGKGKGDFGRGKEDFGKGKDDKGKGKDEDEYEEPPLPIPPPPPAKALKAIKVTHGFPHFQISRFLNIMLSFVCSPGFKISRFPDF